MEEPLLKKQKLVDDDITQVEGYIPDLYKVKLSIQEDKHSVNSVKFSPDGKTFATCSSDGKINIYNLETGECIATLLGHTKGISDIEYSPINSNIIASCSDDLTIRLWSIEKGKALKVLKKHTYHITSVKFNSKGNILISASADETITIWDISSGNTLRTLAAHSDPVLSICLTHDNSIIVSASYDGVMRLFDLETGQCLKTLTYNSTSHGTATASTMDVVNFPITYVLCSPNSKYILSSSLDGYIRLWDYMDNRVIKTYVGVNEKPISEKYICGTQFILQTDSPKIVSGSDSSGVIIWDVQSKLINFQFKNSDHPVLQVDTYDNGKYIACCGTDGKVDILELNPLYEKKSYVA